MEVRLIVDATFSLLTNQSSVRVSVLLEVDDYVLPTLLLLLSSAAGNQSTIASSQRRQLQLHIERGCNKATASRALVSAGSNPAQTTPMAGSAWLIVVHDAMCCCCWFWCGLHFGEVFVPVSCSITSCTSVTYQTVLGIPGRNLH